MARITTEDSLLNVKNNDRFNLCLKVIDRAIKLNEGSVFAKIEIDEYRPEKPAVIALREIAEGLISNDLDE